MSRGVRRLAILALAVVLPLATLRPQGRIPVRIDDRQRILLKGSVRPMAQPQLDEGPLDASRPIGPVILGLKRSAAQQAEIENLLEEQQDPSSPNYHKWLTPEEYADRFGVARTDVAGIASWLQSQGLSIDHLGRGRNWIAFSGTAGQVQTALGTQFHRYRAGGEEHFANATEVSIPAAIEPAVSGLLGLHDFHPQPLMTSPKGEHTLAPDDIATIYDIAPLYGAGIDGTGQKIAIVGASDLETNFADIRAFRTKFNLPSNDPQVVLFGKAPGVTKALLEADLDIEWAGAVAPNATVIYVNSTSVILSGLYAVDQNLAPVISYSYGSCERVNLSSAVLYQSVIQQANVQGITFVAGSGDAGAANCDAWFHNPVGTNGLDVFFPASIPEITAVGGTEFNEGTVSYWSPRNSANGASALSYIPEKAWNDTAADGVLAASGGGVSEFYPKPPWQAGPGVPSDNARDVPDVAMAASDAHDGYIYCSKGDCSKPGGGTSFATPIFAGIVTLLNQYLASRGSQSQPGLGNINPSLYRLAQANTGVFHDITAGDNIVPCAAGTPDCVNGHLGYMAGPGYDLVTGLGSVDANNLVTLWTTGLVVLSSTAVSADRSSMSMSESVQLNVTVSSFAGNSAPAGSVLAYQSNTAILGGGGLPGEIFLGSAALAPTGRTTSFAQIQVYGGQLTAGADTITVVYGGNGSLNGSAASVTVNVSIPATNSAVVPSVVPYPPVPIGQTDSNGRPWHFILTLKEVAGVGTTLTSFIVSGENFSSQIVRLFGSNALPPRGSLSANLAYGGSKPPFTLLFSFSGVDANGYQWTQQLPVQFGGPEQVPYIQGSGLTNAASFKEMFAPGMVMSVFGFNLSQSTAPAAMLPLPPSLGGASVTINGVSAPFYYASPGQLNVQIPYDTAPGIAILRVSNGASDSGFRTFTYSFTVQPSAPGIFVGPDNALTPFPSGSRGQTYTLFITGEGAVSPLLATGATPAPDTPITQLPKPVLPATMTIGSMPAPILFIGIPSGLAGVTQINFTVPSDAPLGVQPVVVTVGGVSSPPANFTVNP
jgi:uncharacterized protein (TIGR03437 family)